MVKHAVQLRRFGLWAYPRKAADESLQAPGPFQSVRIPVMVSPVWSGVNYLHLTMDWNFNSIFNYAQIFSCNVSWMMCRDMGVSIFTQLVLKGRIIDNGFDHTYKIVDIALLKCQTRIAHSIRQSPTIRNNWDATACHTLQRNNAKWLFPK